MTSHRIRAYIYLLIVAAIWGAAGPVIKFTLRGIDPFPFLSYRLALASIFSIIFFLVKGIKLPKTKDALLLVIFYGLLAVPLALGSLFTGLNRSTVLDLTLIGAIGPLVVLAGGAILFHDHITRREKLGVIIVLVGVFINAFYPLIANNSDTRLTGNIFLLLFLFSDTASTLVAKKSVRAKIPPQTLSNFAFILGALTIIPITLVNCGAENLINSIVTLPFKYHLGVWYMALISGSLAYFLFIAGQKSIEVSEAILFSYLQPLFSVPLAILWLGESITKSFIVGGTLIAIGIIIAEYKWARNNKKRATKISN
jgi:drug/metabolite transporter (DMT)-like permease